MKRLSSAAVLVGAFILATSALPRSRTPPSLPWPGTGRNSAWAAGREWVDPRFPGVTLDQWPEAPTPTVEMNVVLKTGMPLTLPGPQAGSTAVPSEEDLIREEVRYFLQNHPAEIDEVSADALRLDYVAISRTPRDGVLNGPDTAYVRLVQTASGLDIEGTQVMLSLTLQPQHMIVAIRKALFPE